MKIRKSFSVRWLINVDKGQNEQCVIDLVHIQTGEKLRVSSMEEAHLWMKNIGGVIMEQEIARTLEFESNGRKTEISNDD